MTSFTKYNFKLTTVKTFQLFVCLVVLIKVSSDEIVEKNSTHVSLNNGKDNGLGTDEDNQLENLEILLPPEINEQKGVEIVYKDLTPNSTNDISTNTLTDITTSKSLLQELERRTSERTTNPPQLKQASLTRSLKPSTHRNAADLRSDCGSSNKSCLHCRWISPHCNYNFHTKTCFYTTETNIISQKDCLIGWFQADREISSRIVMLSSIVALLACVLISAYFFTKCQSRRKQYVTSVPYQSTEIGQKSFLLLAAEMVRRQNIIDVARLRMKYGITDSDSDKSMLITGY